MNSPIALDDLLTHAGWVRGLARSLVADDATADDVTQEVWVAAMRRPPHRRDGVRGWLATVTRNAVRERGRSTARRTRREEAAARPEAVGATVDVVAKGEQHKRLVVAVMDLDEPYRETVLLRFFEGLPPREVADRMDVPVETVRTRTRRALDRLRRVLDEQEGGDRTRWQSALLPLATGGPEAVPDASQGSIRNGVPKMLALKIAAVATVVAAIPAYIVLGPEPPAAAPADDIVAAAPRDAGGGAGRRRVAPPLPGAPEDGAAAPGDEGGGFRVVETGDEHPLPPPEDASVFADGVLEISLSTDPPVPRAKERWDVVVTFRNVGTGPLRFHVPEHTGLVPFPAIELHGDDGRGYALSSVPFQSEWTHGLQGSIVRLEAGETHEVRSNGTVAVPVDLDRPEDERNAARSQKSAVIGPGRYTVTARLAKTAPTVPWGEPNFRIVRKEVPGLWTGTLRATPISVLVAAPNTPLLSIEAPETLRPGGDGVVEFTLRNPTNETREVSGPFAIRRAEKGGPSYFAWFRFDDTAEPCTAAESVAVVLEAGETRTCAVDLSRMRWKQHQTGLPGSPWRDDRLDWPHARRHPAVWVTAGTRDDPDSYLGSNTRFLALEAAPDLATNGVLLELDEVAVNASPRRVLVRLRNGGAEPLRLPADLRTCVALLVGTPSKAPRTTLPAAVATSTSLLEPGASTTLELTLPEGWPPREVVEGSSVCVLWANADPAAGTVGRIRSTLVPLR